MKKLTILILVVFFFSVFPTSTADAHRRSKHCTGTERHIADNAMAFQVTNKHGKHVDCWYQGAIICGFNFFEKTIRYTAFSKEYVRKKTGDTKWRVLVCPYGWRRLGGHSFWVSWIVGFNGEFTDYGQGEEA